MKRTVKNQIHMLVVSVVLSAVLFAPGMSSAAQDAAPSQKAVAVSVTDASVQPAPKLPDTAKASTGDSTDADKKASPKVPETAGDAVGLAKRIFDAINTGNWPLAGVLGLMLSVLGLRLGADTWLAPDHLINSTLGGYLTVFMLSAGGGLSTVLSSSVKLDFRTVSVIVIAALAASGLWQALRDLVKGKTST